MRRPAGRYAGHSHLRRTRNARSRDSSDSECLSSLGEVRESETSVEVAIHDSRSGGCRIEKRVTVALRNDRLVIY